MGTAVALVVYGALLAAAAALVWRRPIVALYAFIVGLAAHNAVMAGLYGVGLRGWPLTLVQAWKEALLAVALAAVVSRAARARRLPFRPGIVDALAVAFGALVVLYALIPQSALGGEADGTTILYALRHDATLIAAFFLGRSLALDGAELRRVGWTVLASAGTVAAIGLVEVYAVPIEWWRDAGVPGYFNDQLEFEYHGPAGLPENFVFNTGREDELLRRLVSMFLSPLGTAFMLVVALLVTTAGGAFRGRPRVVAALVVLCAAALLFTHTRAAIVALAGGLCVLAFLRRRLWPVGAAVATLAVGAAFAAAFPAIAPETHWFPADLAYQREQARIHGGVEGGALDLDEPSLRSHLTSLRSGLETVARHPQGYGLGNAGSTARRRDVPLRAGESTYAELGVETGIAGLVAFVAWNLALLLGLARLARNGVDDTLRWAAAGFGSALAAVLALALQTDVLGIPWLTFCMWLVGGALVAPARLTPAWQRRSIPVPTSATST